MRLSNFIIYNRLTQSFQDNLWKLFKTQEALATGKKINRPSDDVIGISRVMDYRVSITESEQFKKNMDDARAYLELTDGVLNEATNTLKRIQELTITALNGDESSETRAMTAKEMKQLRAHMLELANTRFRNRYLFSGMLTNKQAFTSSGTYQGDTNYIEVQVTPDIKIKENITGLDAFAYLQGSEEVVQLEDGRYIHYIQGTGTEVSIEIRASDDTTVLDSFSFSNVLEMIDRISDALENNNLDRLTAILNPIDRAMDQVLSSRAEVGARLNFLEAEKNRIEDNLLKLQSTLSSVEDADIAEVVSEAAKTEVALQALRETGARIISQSLFDFLK